MRTVPLIVALLAISLVTMVYAAPNLPAQDDKIVGCVELGICGAHLKPVNLTPISIAVMRQ